MRLPVSRFHHHVLLPLLLLWTLALCCNGTPFFPEQSGVLELTESSFTDTVHNTTANVFVLFYSPKSGKCKEIKDDWVKLVKQLNGMVTVAAIDCLAQESVCEAEDVFVEETIPVLKLYAGLSTPKRYGGPHKLNTLASFALSSLPADNIITVTNRNINDRAADQARVLLFTDKTDTPNMYKALAQRLQGRIQLGLVKKTEKQVMKKYNVDSFPTLLVEPAQAGAAQPPIKYDGAMTFPTLLSWLSTYATAESGSSSSASTTEFTGNDLSNLPVPQLTDQSCLDVYCLHGKASLCAVVIMSSSSPALVPTLTKFAAISASRADPVYEHVWLDSDKHADFLLRAFGLYPADYPQLLVLAAKKERYVTFLGAFNSEDVSDWLRRVTAGNVRTINYNTKDGKLPVLDDGQPGDACEPPKPVTPTKSPPQPDRHPGEAYLLALSYTTFPTTVLNNQAAWIIGFAGKADLQSMVPLSLALANKTRNSVRVALVNIDEEPQLAEQYHVTDAPAFYSFQAAKLKTIESLHRYTGELNETQLQQFSLTLLTDQFVQKVRGEEGLQRFMQVGGDPDITRILLFSKHSAVPPLFSSLSIDYSPRLVFGLASSQDTVLMNKFSVKKVPSFVAIGTLESDSLAPGGQKQLQLIAGSFEQEPSWETLHRWCDVVLEDGVSNGGMPEDVKARYKAGLKKQQEKLAKQAAQEQEKLAKQQQSAQAAHIEQNEQQKAATDQTVVSEEVGSCGSAGDADDGGMCTAPS